MLHLAVPTSHRRHAITETEDITSALEVARRAWPELADRPGALLRRLIHAGQEAVSADRHELFESRRHAIERTAGTLTGVYGPGYLQRIREDWPA